jgi:tricorn protease
MMRRRRIALNLMAAGAAWGMASPLAARGDHGMPSPKRTEALSVASGATLPTGLPRDPDVSATQIVFAQDDDLWIVPREGGVAIPLTRPPGRRSRPKFSPDGRTIAFTGNEDGGDDLYTLTVDGGTLTRVTHRGYAWLNGWTPDGRLLYASSGFSFSGTVVQLFTVPVTGGLPTQVPVPYGVDGAVSPDGEWLAYSSSSLPSHRKRYRGGEAPDIWLFNLRSHASRRITEWEGSDARPMWHRDQIYYLSDAGPEHRLNLWSYNLGSRQRRQITRFTDYELKDPSLGPGPHGRGEIVFRHGTDLVLLDLGTHQCHTVAIQIPGELHGLRPRTVDASKFISGWSLSPTGKRALLEARGDLWTVPAESGSPRNLTQTSGVAERDPAWSPDGRWIACFSDAGGEYELTLVLADGPGEPRRLTTLGPGFRYRPTWSPDSQRIAFTDNGGALYLHHVARGETTRIDVNPLGRAPQVSWSPDSSWLAYTRGTDNRFEAIWLYDVAAGQGHPVTSGRFQESQPTFDRKGEYLFFVSARDFSSPAFDSLYGASFIFPSVDTLLAVPLRRDVRPPRTPHSDEEKNTGPSVAAAAPEVRSEQPGGWTERRLTIDLEELERRAVPLAVPRGHLWNLAVTHDGKLIFAHAPPEGEPSIRILDPDNGPAEAQTVVAGTGDFQLSADGRKLLVRKSDTMAIMDPAPGQTLDRPISLAGMSVEIDPRAEWRQIFHDAWRFYRDFFYDEQMHHVDWPAMREQYAPLLERCATRDDVNEVLNEMIGELSVSHAGTRNPGDVERPPGHSVGLLGVDFELHDGAYRIARLYEGAPWDVDARNPLRQSGVNAAEGDYLLAVNRVPIDIRKDPWAAFQGLAGRVATLTVSAKPAIDATAREITVRLLPSEGRESERTLRYRAWIERNRATVERRTGGRVGYIYVPDTYDDGLRDLVRQLNGQLVKEALIIDERWNGGGRGPDRMLELLNRPGYFQVTDRHGPDWHYPQYSHQGPKCMLVNGWAGSGGDNFAYQFRKAGLGKLIGRPTSAALLGGSSSPAFVDGGRVGLPVEAPYDADGTWVIEGGPGVRPDIEVLDDPAQMLNGADPQLDAAIRLMLEELERHPREPYHRPASPDRRVMDAGQGAP